MILFGSKTHAFSFLPNHASSLQVEKDKRPKVVTAWPKVTRRVRGRTEDGVEDLPGWFSTHPLCIPYSSLCVLKCYVRLLILRSNPQKTHLHFVFLTRKMGQASPCQSFRGANIPEGSRFGLLRSGPPYPWVG